MLLLQMPPEHMHISGDDKPQAPGSVSVMVTQLLPSTGECQCCGHHTPGNLMCQNKSSDLKAQEIIQWLPSQILQPQQPWPSGRFCRIAATRSSAAFKAVHAVQPPSGCINRKDGLLSNVLLHSYGRPCDKDKNRKD